MYVCMYVSCTDTIGVCQGQIHPNTQVNIGAIEHMLCMLWVRARARSEESNPEVKRARARTQVQITKEGDHPVQCYDDLPS